jgi:hypothetical protein
MSAERSFHYIIRLDIQRSYGSPAFAKEEEIRTLKEAFETKLKNLASYYGSLASVVWVEEVKPPMPEPLSPIL